MSLIIVIHYRKSCDKEKPSCLKSIPILPFVETRGGVESGGRNKVLFDRIFILEERTSEVAVPIGVERWSGLFFECFSLTV